MALFLHFLKNLAISAQIPDLILHFQENLAISAQFPTLILHIQKKKADSAQILGEILHFWKKTAFPTQSQTQFLHFRKKTAFPAQSLALSHEIPSCRYIIIMNLNPMQETIKFPSRTVTIFHITNTRCRKTRQSYWITPFYNTFKSCSFSSNEGILHKKLP